MIINVVVPILFAYGRYISDDAICSRSLEILEQVEAESNSIVKLFKQAGVTIKNSFDSQAVIQLKREYCEKRNAFSVE